MGYMKNIAIDLRNQGIDPDTYQLGRRTTKPRPEQWCRENRNSLAQFMRTRERYVWVSTDMVNVPGRGMMRRNKGSTARRRVS